jgi:4-phospho-D-threonate 3-dehydrogenase / 4-phospho-D-erythronate 3-dehydrogenase
MKKPVIAITMGDAAGIGPEVAAKVLAQDRVYEICRPLVVGDARVMEKIIDDNKLRLSLNVIGDPGEGKFKQGNIDVLDLANINLNKLEMGRVDRMCGKAAVEYIQKAVRLSAAKKIDAIVTAPLCKEAMHKAGFHYGGHTELLAKLSKTPKVVMMLAGGTLKTVLVTTHMALKKVPGNLTVQKIFEVIRITDESMKKFFGLDNPRITVASLNPHCGEGGILGREEKQIIVPAVHKAAAEGIYIVGPFSPDKAIYETASGKFDVVVVMYHDQSLIPVKLLAYKRGVNVTLGLPFVRTSPCHGTAFDIAGEGLADPSSMFEALSLAGKMAVKK